MKTNLLTGVCCWTLLSLALNAQPGATPDWPGHLAFLQQIRTTQWLQPNSLDSRITSLARSKVKDLIAYNQCLRWSPNRINGLLLEPWYRFSLRMQLNREHTDALYREALSLGLPNPPGRRASASVQHQPPFKRDSTAGLPPPYQRLPYSLYPADRDNGWNALGSLAIDLAREIIQRN